MNEIDIKIEKDDIIQFLDDYTDIVFKAKQSALHATANVLKKKTIQSLQSTGVRVNEVGQIYSDSLQDGVRVTRIKDGNRIGVHILGSNRSGSGTFRLRFFEKGTRDRYQKTKNGTRFLGHISGYGFFESAVNSSMGEMESTLHETLEKMIRKAWDSYN